MTPTPNSFYVAYHLFNLPQNGIYRDTWGCITDGHSDYSEMKEALIDSRHTGDDEYDPARYHVIRINLEEGTSRDVTEDVLADVFPDEPEDDDMPEWQFQRREAALAGHFA